MIRWLLAVAVLATSSPALVRGQVQVGEWHHYTSTVSPTAIAHHNGLIYASTGGGVLIYHPTENRFSTLTTNDGLVYSDLSSLDISGDWMWLGGAAPNGIIQILNLGDGGITFVDLDLDEILYIEAGRDRGFAAYRNGQEVGLVELRWDGQTYSFMDIYRNFPVSANHIYDLDLWGDSLFVSTDNGVLGNNYMRANLKDPLTWKHIIPSAQYEVLQYLIDSTGHFYMIPNEIHQRSDHGWELYGVFGGGAIKHLARRPNGDFVISHSNYLQFLTTRGSRYYSPRADERVLYYMEGSAADEGYVIIRNQGLSRFSHQTRTWTRLPPNTMRGPAYSAILKLQNGQLVAAGLPGIARYNDFSWYNLVPGYGYLSGPDEIRNHGHAQVVASSFFLADTIFYRGKQSWNILQLPDGEIMVGFKGNLPNQVGVLRVDLDNISSFENYDTTNGHLDGLSGDGYITVRHIALDAQANVWIANPYSQIRQNVLAVLAEDKTWTHFSISDSRNVLNYLPTEITFDNRDRVWIGSQVIGEWSSWGGIAVLDYGGTLEDKSDDEWTQLTAKLEPDHSNTVWSLTFDRNDVLWTLTPDGVMGYTVQPDLSLTPFTQYGPYLEEVPFGEGSKIRVDAQNNKWITSTQSGLWVLLDNTTFWPSVDGINTQTSSLLSDEVLDIYLDDEEGVAYIATSKGISTLKIPFKKSLTSYNNLIIFPSPYYLPSVDYLTIDGIRQGSSVKIFTATGRLVRELTAEQGSVQGYQAFWDGKNESGEWVGSGVYLIAAYLADGRSGVGKVAVIRR
ncbi:MAG: hypothetical protein JSU61_10130 [Fidelibacterota bacterium]|nr:MAG: hypothetical protein JSU61_10130 [Candidatus Neomarinimicrobiota bacterium]